MEYVVSDKMKNVSGSMVRELFKLASDPSIIKFGGGNPSAESFPVAAIAEITAEAFKNHSTAMLQYGVSEGYEPLRKTLKKHLSNFKINFEDDDIMIVSGAQQAADLTAKILCNEGDTVITEDPAFVGCLNAFRTYGVNLVGVPVKSDGMDNAFWKKLLKKIKM